MLRRLLQAVLRKPVLWLTARFDSRPDKARIYDALSKLYNDIIQEPGKKGLIIPLETYSGRFVIFSDQHKGARNGADDFAMAEKNYLNALQYYYNNGFCFINLGDCEELWENTLLQIIKNNKEVFEAEKAFLQDNRFIKIYGNHDLLWGNDPLAPIELKSIYGTDVKIYEGVILSYTEGENKLQIFCTHGHQGDARSDGNWLSKLFVARIWAPFQAYLRINPNEPSNDEYQKTIHNEIMYEWSATQKNTIVITGHTHQPVFGSLTHIERLHRNYVWGQSHKDEALVTKIKDEVKLYQKRFDAISTDFSKILPTYFNTGCCCFADGDLTGIEFENNTIRLIKWNWDAAASQRMVLEEMPLAEVFKQQQVPA